MPHQGRFRCVSRLEGAMINRMRVELATTLMYGRSNEYALCLRMSDVYIFRMLLDPCRLSMEPA